MVGLPLAGAAAASLIHTKDNEPFLFLLPLPITIIRLYIAQFQLPPRLADSSAAELRGGRICVAINQIAILPLALFECAAVMACNQTVPIEVSLVAALFLAIYVAMRLISRRYWIIAAGWSDTAPDP